MLRNSTQHVCLNGVVAAVLVFGAAAGGIAAPARNAQPPDVTVYVNGDSKARPDVDLGARATVTWMFARVGVRVAWRDGEPRTGSAAGSAVTIRVRFTGRGPDGTRRDALACAMPFATGGVAIYVMYDRIQGAAGRSSREAPILAHVLAHEIGHVLRGTNAHTSGGVMKAHWDGQDYDAMQIKPLEFTSFDLETIREGLALRKGPDGGLSAAALR